MNATYRSGDSNVLLEVQNLQTEFHLRSANVKAVDGVSFSVAEGECVGLVGESGCGKSTTGLSIMKLLPSFGHVTGGSVKLLGQDLVSLPEREMQNVRGNDVSMIFQDPLTSLNPTWTVGQQIAEAVRLHRDVTIQAQILDLIDALRRDLKMAVILITHDLGVIAARASRVMVRYAGKIV